MAFGAALILVSLMSACADGSPGTPGTATAHLDGDATFFAGVSDTH